MQEAFMSSLEGENLSAIMTELANFNHRMNTLRMYALLILEELSTFTE